MFGMRHWERHGEGHCAGMRHGRGRWRGGRGWGGKHGMGGDDFMRAGRMLAQGDLRLIAIALIAEQPRHGYDIIKQLEEKTSGWYSPSPALSIRQFELAI
jgi:Transcriptional regulator PadR-like family